MKVFRIAALVALLIIAGIPTDLNNHLIAGAVTQRHQQRLCEKLSWNAPAFPIDIHPPPTSTKRSSWRAKDGPTCRTRRRTRRLRRIVRSDRIWCSR